MCLTCLMPYVRVAGLTVADKVITILCGQRCTAAPTAHGAHCILSPLNLLCLSSLLRKDCCCHYGNMTRMNKIIPSGSRRFHVTEYLLSGLLFHRSRDGAQWRHAGIASSLRHSLAEFQYWHEAHELTEL